MPWDAKRILFAITVSVATVSSDQAKAVENDTRNKQLQFRLAAPVEALDKIQEEHSDDRPILVAQGELDELIASDGGGACPISAAIIAAQTVKLMAGLEVAPHPHRMALRIFKDKPALLQGRISNKGFVDLLAYLCQDMAETPIAITTLSAPNSTHATPGQKWLEFEGPDLSTKEGELKILAYTVTTEHGKIRGRHFVLLKESNDEKISFVNPESPLSERFFIVEYRGDSFSSKQRVFFHSPAGLDKSGQTYELNTVFAIRLLPNSPDHQDVNQSSTKTINSKIDALAERLHAIGEFGSPKAWRRAGATFGLPSLDLPTDIGGAGWSATEMIEVFRHAGRHNLNLRDVVGGAHGRPLEKSDSPLSRAVLRELVAGKAYVAVAITEPTAGTDMKRMKSKAVRHENGFKLTGRKLWNARLREATHVVLYTSAASGEQGARSAFLLSIDHPGLRIVDRYAHGLTGNSFGGLEFDGMFVSHDHLLGEDGDGGKIFDEHFQYWRLMQSAAAIGCGEAALDQMATRIQERHAFGGPIGRFTHLQQPLGEYSTKLKMALALAREAAAFIDEGDYEAATPLVNGLKAEGVEIALAACDASMRAHGALGYSRNVDIGDRVRDLMGLRIADGTTDVMRMSVVKQVYGSPLWIMAVHSYQDRLETPPIRGDKSDPPDDEKSEADTLLNQTK